jgi:hypothetical protein
MNPPESRFDSLNQQGTGLLGHAYWRRALREALFGADGQSQGNLASLTAAWPRPARGSMYPYCRAANGPIFRLESECHKAPLPVPKPKTPEVTIIQRSPGSKSGAESNVASDPALHARMDAVLASPQPGRFK